ncbi:MAG: GNAT family N-acetyltransferase [Myxococcaceae bacterium]
MSLKVQIVAGIKKVPKAAWNALLTPSDAPVLRWEWLEALESSGSAVKSAGWEARHFLLYRDDQLVGFAPAWLKFHSMGEYVYDFGWASAASNFGVQYYPKFLVGVPLSPLTARRFVVASTEDEAAARATLLEEMVKFAREEDVSSLHVIFPGEKESKALEELGLFHRLSMQYHWVNAGYTTYDEFLSRFDSKRRNQLKRERGAADKQGIKLYSVRQPDLKKEHAELAWRFYQSTVQKNGWGGVQLNRAFFHRAFETLPERIEMVLAERDGEVIAGAFNLASDKRLYGRYWGCFEDVPFLHFNVCLYYSVDECIRLGREAFEPGAGGEHKIARGFQPTAIHSLHRIFDKRFETAVKAAVARERLQVEHAAAEGAEIAGMKPFAQR